jgi:PAS domain S-box-containing protein
MFSILYVDDEANLLDIGKLFLELEGDFQVETTVSAQDALERMQEKWYDAIISDFHMPGMNGIAFLKTVRSTVSNRPSGQLPDPVVSKPAHRHPTPGDTPFILFTGRGREEVVIEAINSGVDFYLQKGGDPKSQFVELGHKIRQAIRRKRAEDLLYENEERLRFALEGANDGLWDIDLPTGMTYLSPRGCEILGYTFEEFNHSGKKWTAFVHPLDLPATKAVLEEYSQGRIPFFEMEQRLLMKSGDWKWVLTRGKIVERDAANDPVRMTGTHSDITERKKAENDLLQAKKDWEVIFRAMGNPVVILGADNSVIEVNDAVLKKTGKTAGELQGMKCWQIFHGPNVSGPPHHCPFEQLKKSGSVETAEIECEVFGGPYLVSCTPIYNNSGQLEKVIHIAVDVTEKK